MSKNTKKVLSFVALTYVITILFFIMLQGVGGKSNPKTLNLIGLSMTFPLISIIIVEKFIFKDTLKNFIKVSLKFNIWFFIGVLIPVVMGLIINIVSIIKFNTIIFSQKEFVFNVIIGLSIAAISAYIEEVAWRGFLYNNLKFLGIFKLSLLIGFIWALWHTPVTILYKYPSNPIIGVVINFLQMFIISIIITYIRDKSRSVFAAALIHGMFNTMILSSNMDDFKIVLIKIFLGILIITALTIYEFYKKSANLINYKI
ncbi:CPBP family intramembrane glutamic endopeptidase [Clostridium sp. ATCC 25772]|uniref:CPBP family intramembrane glutamic endopeptidase n=1 Tax=Clostridium sp. ATCC 25772 TaxID=1676991 RepID=UPI0007829B94|nr:CPBP family intramembrane glutamic endopeptidase [Clostridium sp. ATCC 25772]